VIVVLLLALPGACTRPPSRDESGRTPERGATGSDLNLPRAHYRITPVSASDRTDLEIELRLERDWPTTIDIAPPLNCYGSGLNLSSLVTIASDAPAALREESEQRWELSVPPDGATLRYRLSFDPALMETDAFAPSTSANHFHVAGCQWMLTIGDMQERREVIVEFGKLDPVWSVYSSLAPEGGPGIVRGNEEQTAATAIGGQHGEPRRFVVEGRPVEAFVAEAFQMPREQIADWIQDIVTHQRTRMGVFDFPFYTVAIRPRGSVVAGTAVDNLFIAFVSPDASATDILRNVSHEMFHSFLPDRLDLLGPSEDSWVRHLWYSEGVVDYMARSLLLERGLLTESQLADRLNRDLRDLAENPHASWPIDAFERAAAEPGGLSQTMKNVAYTRGALIGAHWDRRLRQRGTSLAEVLRRLLDREGDTLPEEDLFQALDVHGIGAQDDFERQVLLGQTLSPDPELLGPNFELSTVEFPSFDPGFDLRKTFHRRLLTGVDPAGPAFAAGLREGARVVLLENASRFSSSWREHQPLAVIAVVDGRERQFEFMPHGQTLSVRHYVQRNTDP
jgi:predicted metalloprotease with PDZ domain